MIDWKEYRLASDFLITYQSNKPQLHLPSKHLVFKVDWKVCEVISFFSGEKDYENIDIPEKLFCNIVDKLSEVGILIKQTETDMSESIIKEWDDWDESSWYMHLRTKDPEFEPTEEGRLERVKKFREMEDSPPNYFKCDCKKEKSINLPKASKMDNVTLTKAFEARRSCRRFSKDSVTIQELSDVLFYTGGILFTNDTHSYGTVAKKSSPSPGARHSIELYILVNNCDNITKGIYHYCQKHHTLNLINKVENTEDFLNDALYEQEYFLNSAVTIFYTSIVDRLKWKYKTSRVYRLIHFEVGHYAQNSLLVASALGLGSYLTAAFKESVVGNKLSIDGIEEIVMYTTGLGHKLEDEAPRKDIKVSENIPENMNVSWPIGEHS